MFNEMRCPNCGRLEMRPAVYLSPTQEERAAEQCGFCGCLYLSAEMPRPENGSRRFSSSSPTLRD